MQDQLSSLLKTAEDLRIKGLAEVSWRDEDEASNKNATNKSALKSRNSISFSTSDQIRAASSASATYSPRLNNDNDYQASCGTGSTASGASGAASTHIPPIPLLNSMQDKHSLDNSDDLSMQPAKKKRGRPPLDDDFDSYSTPKITHVESTAGSATGTGGSGSSATTVNSSSNYNDHNPLDTLSDDGSHQMHAHSNSMLEQNMEIQIDEDENALQGQIIPKIERPDTPPLNYRPEYYDDDENPASPLDEAGDASTSQVKQQPRKSIADAVIFPPLSLSHTYICLFSR